MSAQHILQKSSKIFAAKNWDLKFPHGTEPDTSYKKHILTQEVSVLCTCSLNLKFSLITTWKWTSILIYPRDAILKRQTTPHVPLQNFYKAAKDLFFSQNKVYFWDCCSNGNKLSTKIREGTGRSTETVSIPSKLVFVPFINIKYYHIKILKGFYKLSSLSVKDSVSSFRKTCSVNAGVLPNSLCCLLCSLHCLASFLESVQPLYSLSKWRTKWGWPNISCIAFRNRQKYWP